MHATVKHSTGKQMEPSAVRLCDLINLYSSESTYSRARAAFAMRNLFRKIGEYFDWAKDSAKFDPAVCWVADVTDSTSRNEFYRVSANDVTDYFANCATQGHQEFVQVITGFDDRGIESDAAVFFAPGPLGRLIVTAGGVCPGFLLTDAHAQVVTDNGQGEHDAVSSGSLSHDQRSVMAARFALVQEIQGMSQTVSQQRAIVTLIGRAEDGTLSAYLATRVALANARKGEDRTLSERTLKRWLAAYRESGVIGLAPLRPQQAVSLPVWAGAFFEQYWCPAQPSVKTAYAVFVSKYQGECPSLHQVRSLLRKCK
ncbi:helix-turn-helix domain-containing protein [Pseudomonas lactis]|uniref:helix-turn-helix domain-containing protein n=1 Tax=Pseudomonas TaxID=286 RepID=UPI000BB62CDF|nr:MULTISPECIES: helix-turn-helix domain-containing protein [Pseudomonas]MBA5956882.1 helix-turn-helix domain-containing protein [Pseudomonas lactis]PRW73013.1 helix-turn-helix domain-containing protein [Pseudomonas fluorescens]PRW74285.1 helix-turn-helix domain-containing protein [Pseudomonas fluorescens]